MSKRRYKKKKAHHKPLKKSKVYYLKNNEIFFEYKEQVVNLKEFHNENVSFISPFSEKEAKTIARYHGAYLKMRK